MSTAGRENVQTPAESLAAACRNAEFIRLQATTDGDALAALGQLGAAFHATNVPFHASVARHPEPAATDDAVTITLGAETTADVSLTDEPLSAVAYDAAADLTGNPDPLLALAGTVAAGFTPGHNTALYESAATQLDRRPGVAVPVAGEDALADGLAHTTLVHASFSGDTDTASAVLAELDISGLDSDAHRAVASAVALHAIESAPERATEAVERALRPHVGGPFVTVGGYADVLDACARTTPGLGVVLAIEAARDETEPPAHADEALDAWRDHGQSAHTGLREGETARHDGVFVIRTDTEVPLGTVARLGLAYRSPEPLCLAVGGEQAALAGERAAERARTAGTAVNATATGRTTTGYIDGIDPQTAETEVRRA